MEISKSEPSARSNLYKKVNLPSLPNNFYWTVEVTSMTKTRTPESNEVLEVAIRSHANGAKMSSQCIVDSEGHYADEINSENVETAAGIIIERVVALGVLNKTKSTDSRLNCLGRLT